MSDSKNIDYILDDEYDDPDDYKTYTEKLDYICEKLEELENEIKNNKISPLSELIIFCWGIFGLIQMYKYYF